MSRFNWSLESGGPEVAYTLVRDELRRNPTLPGFDKLLEARLFPRRRKSARHRSGEEHRAGYTRRLARYRCDNCGLQGRQFYWRCPSAAAGETYPPKRTEEFGWTP